MSAAKPKFYIATKHTCRIGHRKLSRFEERNPQMFSLSHAAFDTWEEAYAWMLERRITEVAAAKRVLSSAEKRLATARAMSKPEAE